MTIAGICWRGKNEVEKEIENKIELEEERSKRLNLGSLKKTKTMILR